MPITNDPTGRVSDCTACHARIEEARLLAGMTVRTTDALGRVVTTASHGTLVWRTVDQGHGSAVCPDGPDGRHQPGRVRTVTVRDGRSNVRRT